MSELEIQRSPSDKDIAELRKSLIEYNVARHGFTETFNAAIFVRNEEGALEAGVSAYGWGGTCEVELLWVAEHRRGDGLGTRLMAAVEEEARRVGCNKIILDTFSYQAPDFYKKLGFEITSTIEDFPVGHTHYLLVKRLTS
jgi:GNAT superfamily N-acetyltransferase